jgi:hypothetical protein
MPVLKRNKTVPIRDMLLWTAVLPVAFLSSSVLTLLGFEYGARPARKVAGESTGKVVEWIIFAVRSVIFVAAGTLIAPSARVVAVAIVLGVIHALASENPINNSACRLATVLGTSGAVGYFIAAPG